jgi:hypothetical protein
MLSRRGAPVPVPAAGGKEQNDDDEDEEEDEHAAPTPACALVRVVLLRHDHWRGLCSHHVDVNVAILQDFSLLVAHVRHDFGKLRWGERGCCFVFWLSLNFQKKLFNFK